MNAALSSLDAALSSLDAALAAGPIEADFSLWRTRAGALHADWLATAPTLRDQVLPSAQSELVVALVKDILAVVERHPSLAPGHGVGHVRRVVAHGMILALGEGLESPDTARLLLACAAHDLGRLILTQDCPELRHAEVSGVLVEEHLRGALMPLGPSIFLPVREAVLMHTYVPPDEQLYFRVLDDVRICDGLDCNGTGAGFVRSAFCGSAFADLSAELPDRLADDLSAAMPVFRLLAELA